MAESNISRVVNTKVDIFNSASIKEIAARKNDKLDLINYLEENHLNIGAQIKFKTSTRPFTTHLPPESYLTDNNILYYFGHPNSEKQILDWSNSITNNCNLSYEIKR